MYRTRSDTSSGLRYTIAEASQGTSATGTAEGDIPSLDLHDQEHMADFTHHEFPTGVSWAPETMDINGRKDRRVMCVVAQDKKRYRIYHVDSHPDLDELESVGNDGSNDIMLEDES